MIASPPTTRPSGRGPGLRRDLRAMTVDGAAFSVMVGAGETYLPAFVLALGKSELTAGLIGTLPMLAGAVLQLVSPRAVRWLRSHRRWVVACALVQAASFVPLVVAALLGVMPTWLAFLVATVYWGAGQGTGPAWNAWAETLVPRALRARYFARRARAAQAGVFLGLMGGGLALQAGGTLGNVLHVFAVLFLVSAACRLISTCCLALQSEPDLELNGCHNGSGRLAAWDDPAPSAWGVLRRNFTGSASRLLWYLVLMQLAVQIAGPYFTAFMLRHLNLTYGIYVLLLATSFVTRIVLLPSLGAFARRFGPRPLLWLGACGIVPLPGLWLVSDNFWWLLGIQVLGGAAWGAQELAMLLLFFETIPRRERTGVLTVFNLANAAAMAGGTLLGAAMLGLLGETGGTYRLLFGVSTAARVLPLLLLFGVTQRLVKVAPLALRILAVRPSAGSIDRPVLPSLPDEAPRR